MTSKFKLIVALAAIALAVASCSKDTDSGFMGRVPADARLAAVINVKTMVESAGGTVEADSISLPTYIKEQGAAPDIKLNGSGLALADVALWVEAEDDVCMSLFAVADGARLAAFLDREGYKKGSKTGDYTFYRRNGSATGLLYPNCAASEEYAYFYDKTTDEAAVVKRIENALANPLSATEAGRYASQGNALGAVMDAKNFEDLAVKRAALPVMGEFKGHICIKADVGQDEAVVSSVMFDASGKKVQAPLEGTDIDTEATISPEALAYLPSNECLIYAAALRNVDWDAAVDRISAQMGLDPMQKLMMGMAKEYLNKIDGTVALGIGFDGGTKELEAIENGSSPMGYMPVTLVIQTLPGKEKGFVGDISAILGTFHTNVTPLGNGFSAKLPGDMGMIYGKEEKNMAVFSNRPIENYGDNAASKAADLSKYFAATALYLPADYPLMKSLGINEDIVLCLGADLKAGEGIGRLKITGDAQGKIIERALRTFLMFKKGFEPIMQQEALHDDFTPLYDEE